MPNSRRSLLLRALTVVTIGALLLSMVGLTLAAPPAIPIYSLSTNLVSYWPLDETPNGSRADAFSTNTLTETATVNGVSGSLVGNGAALSVSTNKLTHASNAALSVSNTDDFTLAGWLRFTAKSSNQNIILTKASTTTNSEYILRYLGTGNGADYLQFLSGSGTSVTAADAPINANASTWYFFAFWKTGGKIYIQVNLGTIYSATAPTITNTGQPFVLGGTLVGEPTFNGVVDELGMWKSAAGAGGALDAGQRQALYNNGSGCTYPFTGCFATPTPTATSVSPSGNLIRNPSFTIAPHQSGAFWADLNRVVQSPASDLNPPIEHMPYGSCGELYWVMSRTGGTDGSIYQDFGWSGGPMFINFEALTDSYVTIGHATLLNRGTGEEQDVLNFTNGSMAWRTFKTTTASQPAGQYRLGFEFEGFGSGAGLAVDNVNVRRNYWGNDCAAADYHGDLPTTSNATAVAVASATPPGAIANQPVNSNCDFEQGWAGHTHNQGARLVYSGGATGPTYGYLFTLYGNGSDPAPTDFGGRINVPFEWLGGQMYVSWFTGPGTRVQITVRNTATGGTRQLQSATSVQTYSGWLKRSYGGFSMPAGNYVIEATSPVGQVAALDGIAVSSGGFASGPCSNSNTSGDNNATATQHVANTAAAATATSQPAAVNTAHAVQTNEAAAYATYLAAQYHTMTQNAHVTQTQAPLKTQTQAAAATATQHAHETATARGTPAPTVTRTPQPLPTLLVCTLERPIPPGCVADPPTVEVPDVDSMTAIAATQTAEAAAVATFFAAANATQTAQAQATQQANATATAVAAAATAAAGDATAPAAATQTAAAYATTYAGVTATAVAQLTADAVASAAAQATAHAQQTANAAATAVSLATQQAGQTQATQTAVALQTQLATQANATANAAATTTARAVATTVAQTTATAQVAATQYAATQQASGTTVPGEGDGDLPPVDDRPEPSPGADCERPSSPLQVANWIDYEVCRVLTWFAWSPDNTDQLMSIEDTASDAYPLGILTEVGDTMGVFGSWLTSQPWCQTGFCQDQPLAPLNLEASGILNGDWDFADGAGTYSDQCTLLMAPLLGPYIQSGMCFCVNIACALGVLPWFQLLFNIALVVIFLIYVGRTWLTSAHT